MQARGIAGRIERTALSLGDDGRCVELLDAGEFQRAEAPGLEGINGGHWEARVGGVLLPLGAVGITQVQDATPRSCAAGIGGHAGGEGDHRVELDGGRPGVDLLMHARIIVSGFGKRAIPGEGPYRAKHAPMRTPLHGEDALAPALEGDGVNAIVGMIDEAGAVDVVIDCEVIELMKRANLVPLVGRKRHTVGEKEDFSATAGHGFHPFPSALSREWIWPAIHRADRSPKSAVFATTGEQVPIETMPGTSRGRGRLRGCIADRRGAAARNRTGV